MSLLKLASFAGLVAVTAAQAFVNQTTCNGKTYTYQELAGYGFVPGSAKDEFGDTLGGIGSSLALDRSQWKKLGNGSYTGVVWGLPDRGWNTEGTLNFQPRVHKFNILFTPQPSATVANPSAPNLLFTYKETIRFYGPDGTPTTGLDADATGYLSYPGFPDLPAATYAGDGFGGDGPGGKRISIDAEGLVLSPDGGFWVSDEYGPYVYRFDSAGILIGAIRPPDSIIPLRNGTESFSADSPTFMQLAAGITDDVTPSTNPTGRTNNQGFEGLTVSGDGKTLYVLSQSAANQEGGLDKQTRRYARFYKYDITVPSKPRFAREYVVPLPLYNDPTAKPAKNPKAAAQSEIFHIQDGQFFILSRDSGAGHGQTVSTSVYRQIDVFDIDSATDIKGQYDCATCSIASTKGVLKADIIPASYCPFLDFNVNAQLNRFGVHNGGVQDAALLNEKWESIGIVPVDGLVGDDDEWFVFSFSDNDFITQHGAFNDGKFTYADASGFELDNQALVFKIKLPDHSRPFPRGS